VLRCIFYFGGHSVRSFEGPPTPDRPGVVETNCFRFNPAPYLYGYLLQNKNVLFFSYIEFQNYNYKLRLLDSSSMYLKDMTSVHAHEVQCLFQGK
jgi:hypothetical protein